MNKLISFLQYATICFITISFSGCLADLWQTSLENDQDEAIVSTELDPLLPLLVFAQTATSTPSTASTLERFIGSCQFQNFNYSFPGNTAEQCWDYYSRTAVLTSCAGIPNSTTTPLSPNTASCPTSGSQGLCTCIRDDAQFSKYVIRAYAGATGASNLQSDCNALADQSGYNCTYSP